MRKKTTQSGDNVIIEYYRLGNSVKVSAIDPDTLTEVSIVGPTNATDDHLAQLAIRKLRYVMEKGMDPEE